MDNIIVWAPIILHFKGIGMRNLQYEVRICQKSYNKVTKTKNAPIEECLNLKMVTSAAKTLMALTIFRIQSSDFLKQNFFKSRTSSFRILEPSLYMNLGGCVIPIQFMTSNWSYFEFSHHILQQYLLCLNIFCDYLVSNIRNVQNFNIVWKCSNSLKNE